MIDIVDVQRRSSHPSEYKRTNIKDHDVYVSIPKIGTEVCIGNKKIRTDQQNRIVVSGAVGEIYIKREDVINILKGYITYDNEPFIMLSALKNTSTNGNKIFNTNVINKHTRVINGVPIMDWIRLKPSPEMKKRDVYVFFVPKDAGFTVCGSYSEEYTGHGDYIVCDPAYNSPNFATRRIVRGKIFDAMYARTRAFDNIPKNLDDDYKTPVPKSWISTNSTQGVIATFKAYNEKVFTTIENIDYASKGYNIGDTNEKNSRLVTNIFILKRYSIAGESYLTKDKQLVYRLVYKGNIKEYNKDVRKTFEFSPRGFGEAREFVNTFIKELLALKEAKEFISDYKKKLMKVFEDWTERLKTYDKHKVVQYSNTNTFMYNNKNTLGIKTFDCYKECNNNYVVGSVSGGMISLENNGDKYNFVLTLIVDDEATEFREECTTKGIESLTDIYVKTLLR